MPTYNYSEISDFEFESLCRDLLQAELGLALELFAPGPDRGIDIRYIGVVNGEEQAIVAQCKRWAEDSYSTLLSHLTRVELPKVQTLAPTRYILMTSVGLSPHRKDEIVTALHPWVRSPSDVFGREDLSGLLARHPEVERRHIKLWLTSAEVLDALLNSDLANRSEGAIEHAQRQLRLWVPNPSFERARAILKETRVCVISGAPGIGKTMLADVLLADYVSRGYEPVVISEDIQEGERAWRRDRRQVFHYDDFLGHVTYGELRLRKNEGSRLARFIQRFQKSKDKRFILTTREYILSEARHRYERLSDIEFDLHKSIVSLDDYTSLIRARILYNHLFFSDLDRRLKAALVPEEKYWDVIRHRNYNPRVIDHVVSLRDRADLGPEEFVSKMIATLDNPTVIWQSIFRNLSAMARRVLLAVASLPSEVLLEDVQSAVRNLAPNNFDLDEFRSAVEMVEGTFLKLKEARPGCGSRERIVTINDPSVQDYLLSRLAESDGEVDLLLERAIFFEQCVVLYQIQSHTASNSGGLLGQALREDRGWAKVAPGAFASRAIQLITGASPRLVRVKSTGPDYFKREEPSLERRAAFLASLLAENQTDTRVADSAVSALQACCNEWEAGQGSSREGMDLLRQVKDVETLLPRNALMRAERAFLGLISGRFEQTDDFTALVDLADLSPSLFVPPHRSLRSWRSEFRDFLADQRSWLFDDLDDPDGLQDELNAIGNVAEALGEDISDFAVDAEERISELFYESGASYEPDEDDWRESYSAPSEPSEGDQIDALFESLR